MLLFIIYHKRDNIDLDLTNVSLISSQTCVSGPSICFYIFPGEGSSNLFTPPQDGCPLGTRCPRTFDIFAGEMFKEKDNHFHIYCHVPGKRGLQ